MSSSQVPTSLDDGSSPNSNGSEEELSTIAIAIIVICVVFGLALVLGFMLLIRRMRRNQDDTHDFIHFDYHRRNKVRLPWQKEQHEQQQPLPPPETHDLVFSSILQHPPRPPPTSTQSLHTKHNSIDHQEDSMVVMFEDGYSLGNWQKQQQLQQQHQSQSQSQSSSSSQDRNELDPILMSLVRQRQDDFAGYYRSPQPTLSSSSDPKTSVDVSEEHHRMSYHVW
ncbi:hypothetical protein BCR43DRAFT_514738 [Syncephalastrum racemosum]|uniref:Uncharacterized protein n=1 Tax=Syncephalastrum racemosum TaxID=13706 RepID=A0A1X2HBY9_SYNRA|nr:hypothetical protein BCR43DRAFT_514738 [Syncephalastrum racemosum]